MYGLLLLSRIRLSDQQRGCGGLSLLFLLVCLCFFYLFFYFLLLGFFWLRCLVNRCRTATVACNLFCAQSIPSKSRANDRKMFSN